MSSVLSFEEFRKDWLKGVVGSSPTEKGRNFALKLMERRLGIERDSPDLYFCDGSYDGGIDLAYLDRGDSQGNNEEDEQGGQEVQTWYVVQSKFGRAFRGHTTIIREATKLFDTLDGTHDRLNSLSEDVVAKIRLFLSKEDSDNRLVFFLATENDLTDSEKRTLQDILSIGRVRFGPGFDVDSYSIADLYKDSVRDVQTQKIRVSFDISSAQYKNALWVGSIPLMTMYEFLREYHNQTMKDLDRLYEKNVRRFLGNRIKVNKGIQETLRNDPSHFGLYNNGVTIVVSDIEEMPSVPGKVNLVDPYVVNGCQTTKSIWIVLNSF